MMKGASLWYIHKADLLHFQKSIKQFKIKHWPFHKDGDWYKVYVLDCPKLDFLKIATANAKSVDSN